jgi:hypothetical protein
MPSPPDRPTPPRKSGWSAERREAARARILKHKPWEKSTGPRTKAGKERSSLNALKTGGYSVVMREYETILKLNADFLAAVIKARATQARLDAVKNELIKKRRENNALPPPPYPPGQTN